MSGKKIDKPVPGSAVPIWSVGSWTIYVSKAARSFYIELSDSGVEPLKLSLIDILDLVKSMGVRPSDAKSDIVARQENAGEASETVMHRRRFKRYTRRCEAEFTAGDMASRGIASDFSLNGLFIKTNYPAKPDTMIDITIHLPDGSTAKLKGKVKRSMKTAIGKVTDMPIRSLKNGMGVELIVRDTAYLHFIRSLL